MAILDKKEWELRGSVEVVLSGNSVNFAVVKVII